jgi:cation diffusion facilitator family transporter
MVSLVVGSALLAAKFVAWQMTNSAAVLSDALESIVNVVAAVFAIGAIAFAGRPADRNHPYGHGKMEFFTAVFEGGLVAFAAVMICYEAVVALIEGPQLERLDIGMGIILAAGVGNAVLGWYLVRVGKKTNSPALIADGTHVLADFWTSAGVALGLLLVHVTGIQWLDPVIALIVGILLGFAGIRLIREAAGGLLDEEDPELLEQLAARFEEARVDGVIEVHDVRAIRNGAFTHVDAHLVVPEYWTVEQAHDFTDRFEHGVIKDWDREGEIIFHTDPCRRSYCGQCPLEDCEVRQEPFNARIAMTRDTIAGPPLVPEDHDHS